MQIVNCTQGTDEWLKARLGVATASCFEKILSPLGKPSKQVGAYANQLIAEFLCGEPPDGYQNEWMARGNELEPDARAFYETRRDCDVVQVGFVLRDDGQTGCSPDGLIGDDGLLEIKCPAPHTHVEYLLTGKMPNKYIPQVQGQMYVAEREWCDFLSFHPQMDPVLIRIERDEKYIAGLIRELNALHELIETRKAELTERGITPMEQAA